MARPYEKYRDATTGEYTPEFEAFYDAVAKSCGNFDCNQVAEAMNAGQSPEQCAEQFNVEFAERLTECATYDPLDHDHSMDF